MTEDTSTYRVDLERQISREGSGVVIGYAPPGTPRAGGLTVRHLAAICRTTEAAMLRRIAAVNARYPMAFRA